MLPVADVDAVAVESSDPPAVGGQLVSGVGLGDADYALDRESGAPADLLHRCPPFMVQGDLVPLRAVAQYPAHQPAVPGIRVRAALRHPYTDANLGHKVSQGDPPDD